MRQALAVAAKAPQPGTVKTRLQTLLSEQDAAELYRCFLRDTVALMESVPETDVIVSYTPEGSERLFEGITSNGHQLLLQRGVSFGRRLFNALDDLLSQGYDSVAIMDSDSPTLPPDCLRRAFEELARPGDRVVLGPTSDGGYYLIGIKKNHSALFDGIDWSTERVLSQTIARARELSLDVSLLPEWFDVDNIEDLQRLWREVVEEGRLSTASNTSRFLSARWPTGIQSQRNDR
jgi:rSAM/selenodomain-associated transferase 1